MPDAYLTNVTVLAANLDWLVDTSEEWIGQCPGCLQRWTSSPSGRGLYRIDAQGHQGPAREFVGFVWLDDISDRTGVLVEAADSSEAHAVVQAAFGPGFGVSIWNEKDAAGPR